MKNKKNSLFSGCSRGTAAAAAAAAAATAAAGGGTDGGFGSGCGKKNWKFLTFRTFSNFFDLFA